MARTAPVPDIPPIPGMNPGVVVAGGGGGGGGGSGGDGSDGNGNASANEEKGGSDASGDGQNAGACGQGSEGGCVNCHHNVAKGDPVDVTSGKVFTVPKADLFLPGTFDLELLRSYSSANREVDVGMGFGWTHGLAWRLEDEGRIFVLRSGDGRRMELPHLTEPGTWARAGKWGIYRTQQGHAVRPGNEFVHYFSPIEPRSRIYKLDSIQYRGRGRISLQYDGARLARVVDTVGRVILLEGSRNGRITSISVPDPHGRTIVFARYAYDNEGNLVAAADADGNMTRYAYDGEHRLVRLEYPSGIAFHFVYDPSGRCIETWGAYPGGVDPALAADLPRVLHDDRTRAKGVYHCRFDYGTDYSEAVDSVRTQRFFAGPGGKIAKAVDARGGVTTRSFDESGNPTTVTDPTGATWSYEYDELGDVVGETDPEGAHVRVERDGGGRETKLVDPAGGVVEITRDAAGEVEEIKDQVGGIQRFFHDARGLVTEIIDERGGRHILEYDLHANVVSRTNPTGGTDRYTFDHWGRPLTERTPTGGLRRYTFSDAGLLRSLVDALGRIFAWEHDAMGNVVREINPDGSSEAYEYGGLNWPCRIRRADGSDARMSYNREGWLLEIENERGDIYEFERGPTGLVTREKDFHGCVTVYGHDAKGRVNWYDDGRGKHHLTHSPAGRLLQEEAPDDHLRTYAYDIRGELIACRADDTGFTWERDAAGKIVNEELTVGGRKYAISSVRDPSGDRSAFRTSLGHHVRVRRDPRGLVTEVFTGEDRAIAVTRDPSGLPIRTEFARGGALVDEYDAEFQLRRRKVERSGESRPSSQEPEWMGPRRGGFDRLYEYTPVGEVSSVSSADGTSVEFEYDIRRSLLRRQVNGSPDALFSADPSQNYYAKGSDAKPWSYAKGNQLIRYGDVTCRYDQRGYLVEKRRLAVGLSAEEVTRFEWNSWGYLSAVEMPNSVRVEYDYDPFARRLAKRVLRDGSVLDAHHYVWDLVSMVHDVKLDSTGTPASTSTYLFEDNGDDVPIGHRDGAQWIHYVADANGAPDELVDPTGRPLGRLERTPFGRTRQAAGTSTTPFRFPGQQEDAETGLHYNRYRYYDPDSGRYISPDPIGLAGGLNFYSYGPNPVSWIDPMGLNKHYMTVTSDDDPSLDTWSSNKYPYKDADDPTYKSGKGKLGAQDPVKGASDSKNPCPRELATNPKCHTEQKFCHDLVNKYPKGRAKNKNYQLEGRNPPCPMCHRAMMRAAKQTGANINYTWGRPPQTVKYTGGSGDADLSGVRNRGVKKYDSDGSKLTEPWQMPKGKTGQQMPTKQFWGAENIN